MQTIIFLNKKRYQVYDYAKLTHKSYRLVAIVNSHTYAQIPENVKAFFAKIYQVETSHADDVHGNLSIDVTKTYPCVEAEISQAGGGKNIRFICGDEANVLLSGHLRDKYNIPGASFKQLQFYRDKLLMKKTLHAQGMRVPQFQPLDLTIARQTSQSYFAEISHVIGCPFIIKPTAGVSSLDTHKIENYAEFERWLKTTESTNMVFECEEFIEGDLYHVDSLVEHQKVAFACASKYAYPNLDFFNGKLLSSIPLQSNNPLKLKLTTFSDQALHILGPIDGAVHMEMFVKQNGEVVFLEVAARAPGAIAVASHQKTYGINLLNEDFNIKTNNPLKIPKKKPNNYTFWGVVPKLKGRVLNCVEPTLKSQAEFHWSIKPGQIIKHSAEDFSDNALKFLISHADYDTLYQDFEILRQFNFIERAPEQ